MRPYNPRRRILCRSGSRRGTGLEGDGIGRKWVQIPGRADLCSVEILRLSGRVGTAQSLALWGRLLTSSRRQAEAVGACRLWGKPKISRVPGQVGTGSPGKLLGPLRGSAEHSDSCGPMGWPRAHTGVCLTPPAPCLPCCRGQSQRAKWDNWVCSGNPHSPEAGAVPAHVTAPHRDSFGDWNAGRGLPQAPKLSGISVGVTPAPTILRGLLGL